MNAQPLPSRQDMAKAVVRIVDLSAVLHQLLLTLEQLPHGPGHARDPLPAIQAVTEAMQAARSTLYEDRACPIERVKT